MNTKLSILTTLIAGTAMALPAYGQTTETPGQIAQTETRTNLNQVRQLVTQAEQSLARSNTATAERALEQARQLLAAEVQDADARMRTALTAIQQQVDAAWRLYQQQDLAGARQQLVNVENADWGDGQTQAAQAGQPDGESVDTVTVQPQAPTIRVATPDPQVTVRQSQPQVQVDQGQPEIIVRQGAPVVTVDIPQPQIIVRMPEPDVSVSQRPPEVDVEQASPRVSVADQNEPQVEVDEAEADTADVRLTRSAEGADVQIRQAEQRPNIRYEREEAEIRVNQGEGEPGIRYERMAAGQQPQQREAMADNAPAAPRESANEAVNARSSGEVALTVGELKGYDIVGANNETLGDVQDVVNVDDRLFVVIASGGFLGLGEDQTAIALSSLTVRGDNFVAPNVTEEQIEELADFDAEAYRSLPDEHSVTVGST
ncbi:PRC-barrel domain-containing protein [Aureimonas glaciei]|uniref:PRC-barrel domain-containing protein n=1 Tax=Aureimonas glaciei TaxID=1776957 RepID=A0A916XVR0_9HYPH|nr:PRC-barrel domain-containing protein [Aureimonas glaciei]GGD15543.1 hypothetical protein GCM10011335_17970 [Aureimonas glaciei]